MQTSIKTGDGFFNLKARSVTFATRVFHIDNKLYRWSILATVISTTSGFSLTFAVCFRKGSASWVMCAHCPGSRKTKNWVGGHGGWSMPSGLRWCSLASACKGICHSDVRVIEIMAGGKIHVDAEPIYIYMTRLIADRGSFVIAQMQSDFQPLRHLQADA